MRMLLILILLAALAAGGFLTRPDEAAQKAHADETLASASGDGIGALIETVVGGLTREAKFEDMLVATRYTVSSGGSVVLECLGAYSQFFCSQPNKK